MTSSPHAFADHLTEAIYTIKAQTGKSIAVIQDELGYAVGREGDSFIAFLRKANVPSRLQDVEQLAFALVQRGGLDRTRCKQFLGSAGHSEGELVIEKWFGPEVRPTLSRPDADRLAPFVVGPPIRDPRQFFGRQNELVRIFNLWQALPLQHMAVIGERRSGKTSLLHYVMQITTASPAELRPNQRTNWLPFEIEPRWIFVDFQNPHMRRRESLLRHLARGMQLHLPEPYTLEDFVHAVTEFPLTAPTIVVIDELSIGMQASELDCEFWWGMRAILNAQISENLAFLIASPQDPADLAEEQGQTSPFFNMFNTLQLGPMTEAEARCLIAASPVPIPPGDVGWILEKSGLRPSRLQILCQEWLLAHQASEGGAPWQERGLQRFH